MTKLLLSASIAFLFAGTTYASQATCDVTKETHTTKSYGTVDVNLNEPAKATLSNGKTQEFSFNSVRVNPDSSVEFIDIDGYSDYQCDQEYLYSDAKGNYGVKTTCMDKKAITTISCSYNN